MVMKHKITWAVIGLFLAVLFIVSFQPIITGYSILDVAKGDLSSYPYPFVKNNLYNDVAIVLGDDYTDEDLFAAWDVAYSIKGLRPVLPEVITERELAGREVHNLILVGTPCTNPLVAKEIGTSKCEDVEHKGLVALDVQERGSKMIVTGRTGKDVRLAAIFLLNNKLYAPMGNIVKVIGSLENPNGLDVSYSS